MTEIETASSALIAAFRADSRYQRVEKLSRALMDDPEFSTSISGLEALQVQCRRNERVPARRAAILREIASSKERITSDPLLINFLGDYTVLANLARAIRGAIEGR